MPLAAGQNHPSTVASPPTSPALPTPLLPGTTVRARGLAWEVVHVEPAGAELRYRLRCAQGDLRGREIDLLSPFEVIEPIATELRPTRPGPLQEWLLYHQAFLLEQALGPSALLAVQPGRLEIAPYQIVPVMRALSMTRPRLLLADGVGLGKTIEAGLIIAELIARRRAHRVLIVSPAGPLLTQWQAEMRERFGLRFEAVRDWGSLQEKRRENVLGANPFDHVALCLVSLDFAKQEKVLVDLDRTTWDLVVIDEAHHCVRLGTAGDGEDSRRRRLAEVLARQADALLLLTATPHDGYDAHFASLLELLDPSLLDGRGQVRGTLYQRHTVRRLKNHIRDPQTKQPKFRERDVHPRPVTFDPGQQPRFSALQQTLLAFITPRLKAAIKTRQFGEVLAFVSLLKRSVSTVRACGKTLRVIAERYGELVKKGKERDDERKQRLRSLADYRRRIERYGALSAEEEADQAALEAEDIAAQLQRDGDAAQGDLLDRLEAVTASLKREQRRARDHAKKQGGLQRALEELIALAEGAEAEDPKPRSIIAEITAIRSAEPRANILVYTEYTDSQTVVTEALRAAVARGELTGEVLTIEGEDPEKTRAHATGRFQTEDDLILVSTDATAEGLNLHDRCHHLIHVELPYNPNRLEQRNGRIDRYGQTFNPQVRYLYLAGTFEERVLLRLVAKYERQRKLLTHMPNTLGLELRDADKGTESLLAGLAQEEPALGRRENDSELLFKFTEEPVETTAYQELLAEIDRAIGGFHKATKTHPWLGREGLASETEHLDRAADALTRGRALAGADLLSFVRDAVAAEARSDDAVRDEPDDITVLQLPTAWTQSRQLADMPGWDEQTRTLRVTTNIRTRSDSQGNRVAYLGRAHPIVRRALDHVRNLHMGDGSALDRRVAVVAGDGPALLYTFLCSVRSDLGRELERVIAVRIAPKQKPEPLREPETWLALAARDSQIPTREIWDRHFSAWAADLENSCREAAAAGFVADTETFLRELRAELAAERVILERWLDDRTAELCGLPEGQLLFVTDDLPRWRQGGPARARLLAFATDAKVPSPKRQEAQGVLRLHDTRAAALDRRARAAATPPITLGLLLIAPAEVRR